MALMDLFAFVRSKRVTTQVISMKPIVKLNQRFITRTVHHRKPLRLRLLNCNDKISQVRTLPDS